MDYKEIIEAVGLVAGLAIGFGAIVYIAEEKREGWVSALAIIYVPIIFIVMAMIC